MIISHLERVIFLSIIEKLKDKNKDANFLTEIFEKIRPVVEKYSGKKTEEIKEMEKAITSEMNENLMFINKPTFSKTFNSYAVYFLRGLLNKKEEKTFFGKKAIAYDAKDFEEIKKLTKI